MFITEKRHGSSIFLAKMLAPDARDHAFLSENRRDDAYDRQSSSHLAISMVNGTENTLEPLYFIREMLEDMKTVTAFADAQNHVFH